MTMSSADGNKQLVKIVKYGGLVFFGLIIARLLGYVTRIVLARILTPEGYGLLFLGISIFTVLSAFHIIGLHRAIQRYVAIFVTRKNPTKIKSVIVSSFQIALPLSIILAVALFFLADWLAVTYFTPDLGIVLKLLAVMFPFTILLDVSNFSMIGFQKIKYQVYAERIIKSIFTLGVAVTFLWLGWGVIGGVLGYVIGVIVASLAALYFLERRVFPFVRTQVKTVPMKAELIAFSTPIFFSEILDTLVRNASTIMLGSLATVGDVGIYQAALPSSQLIMIIPIALSSLFIPIVADLYERKKKKEIASLYRSLSKWMFYISLPIAVFFFLFSGPFLGVLFGQEYIGGTLPLFILALGFLALAFSELSIGILDVVKKTRYHFANSAIALSAIILLNIILIGPYGVLGAAIATTITLFMLAIIRAVEVYYELRMVPVSWGFGKALVAAGLSGGLVYFILPFFGLGLVTMIVFGLGFTLLYGLLLVSLRGLDAADLMILKMIERKIGIRIGFARRLVKP